MAQHEETRVTESGSSLSGTLTAASIRGCDPSLDVVKLLLGGGAINVETRGEHYLAWFGSARKALQAASEVIQASPERLSGGIATGDVESDFSRFRLIEEALGAANLTESGQLMATLGTQELVRPYLNPSESFSDVGTRTIGAGSVPTRLFLLNAPGLRTEGRTPPTARHWNSNRFIGRTIEIEKVLELFEAGRMVTIVGPPGIGKSSLAARIELEVVDSFADRSVWVDLAMVRRDNLLLHRVAEALEIHTLHEPTLFDQIARKIGERSLLLVLDAIDHIQDAAGQFCERLLEKCSNVAVMATAPRRCATGSESVYQLNGLEFPSAAENPHAMLEFDAVQCFLEAARSVDSSFSLDSDNAPAIAGIAEAVEGSPWGIRMAASRASILTPHQILTRLRNDPLAFLTEATCSSSAIESGMRSTLSLLSPAAQCMFSRLGVFRGPFNAEAIEEVCTDKSELPRKAVLAALRELVEVQFVQPYKASQRSRAFYLAPLARKLSLALLEDPSRIEASARLVAYLESQVSALVEKPYQTSSSELERFDLLYEDVRACWLNQLRSRETTPQAVDSIGSCFNYWLQRGYFEEGLEIATIALAAPGSSLAKDYVKSLNLAAWCCIRSGKYDQARVFVKLGIRMAIAAGSRHYQIALCNTAAGLACDHEKHRTAARCFKAAITLIESGEKIALYRPLYTNYAATLSDLGRFSEAEAMFRKSNELIGKAGEWADLSLLVNRAHFHLCREDWKSCWNTLEEACDLYTRAPDASKLVTLYGTAIGATMGQGLESLSRALLISQGEIIAHFDYVLSPKQRRTRERNAWCLADAKPAPNYSWRPEDPLGPIVQARIYICNKVL